MFSCVDEGMQQCVHRDQTSPRSLPSTSFETASFCCLPASSTRLVSSQASRNPPAFVTHLPVLALEVTDALCYTLAFTWVPGI